MSKTNNDEVKKGLADCSEVASNPSTAEGGTQKRHTRRKHRSNQQVMDTVAEVHRSAPARVHSSGRRTRSQSRHDRHKCHKHRQKSDDGDLLNQMTQLRSENYLLNRRLNASMSSLDSGLPNPEGLPPFDIDLKKAYQHVKQENSQLIDNIKQCRIESEQLKDIAGTHAKENACLKEDIVMLKNLVYRLNVELEKLQDLRDKAREQEGERTKTYELPKYYHKNFLKPILPLLKAYSETIEEKTDLVNQLERNFDRFSVSFNELLKENETLYKELEAKLSRDDGSVLDELKQVRKELSATKEEKELHQNLAKMEANKLEEVQIAYQTRVNQLEREKEVASSQLQEIREEVFMLRGKNTVIRQELERVRSDDESKIPLVVHSASINECKRLFQTLKNEHDTDKDKLLHKLKEYELKASRKEEEVKKDMEERLILEQGNFDLAFECEGLKRRIAELEGQDVDLKGGKTPESQDGRGEDNKDIKKRLRDAQKRNTELESKLQKTKKRLQQSMSFAEDLVKEQEGLLFQLHEKQKENSAMVTQFGSLKKKLKNVEKGANAELESVEDKIRSQNEENRKLSSEVERLKKLLSDRENQISTVETSS